MENAPPAVAILPTKKTLENYAISYMGAYLNTVKLERPERLPALARNQFHEIDVCLMPNGCFAMLFEKAEKMDVIVNERDWDYVEGKIMSGLTHLVAVYAHEGITVADAIARGKKDAIRDIRSAEDSSIAKAVTQLEKIVDGLNQIEKDNKGVLGLGEQELEKLGPIRDAIVSAGPEVDMLAIIDALKNYQSVPTFSVDSKERTMFEKMAQDLGDLSDVIRRVEVQDKKLEEIERSLRKVMSEYNRTIDERISKGLAVVLQASDKKIDKGLSVMKGVGGGPSNGSPKDFELRLEKVDKAIGALHMQIQDVASRKPPVLQLPPDLEIRLDGLEKASKAADIKVQNLMNRPIPKSKDGDSLSAEKLNVIEEVVTTMGDLKDNIARLNARLMKIEEFLLQIQTQGVAPRMRTLKRKL